MRARRVSFAWRIREVSMMWSDEQAEYLHSLWKEGLSASQCAKLINDKFPTSFTRSACIGRVHRMGIADRPSRSNAKATRPRKPSPPARSDATPSRQSTERATPEPDRSYSVDPVMGPLAHDDDPDFIGPRLRMTVRTMPLHGACRWPIGSADESGFHFCGRHCEAGDSYCEFHARIAYAPKSARQKRTASPTHYTSPRHFEYGSAG